MVRCVAYLLPAAVCFCAACSPSAGGSVSGSSAAGSGGGGAGPSSCASDRGVWDDPPAAATSPSYRTSLAQCWSDANCPRVMLVAHGGQWDGNYPYDSRGAFVHAVQHGADGIKGDLRITADGVLVVTHSSPIQLFESPECAGRKIEEMSGDEVTCCHLVGSTTQTFQRVSDLLAWAKGRTIVMLDVKEGSDFPRAIAAGIAAGAQDFLFLEVQHLSDYQEFVVGAPGWEQIHYLVQLGSPADADAVIAMGHGKQAFMFEMLPSYPGYDASAMKAFIAQKLHPAGVRAFSSTPKYNPTAADHQALFDEGFDVVMTYDLSVGLPVREAVNAARGVAPP